MQLFCPKCNSKVFSRNIQVVFLKKTNIYKGPTSLKRERKRALEKKTFSRTMLLYDIMQALVVQMLDSTI